MRRQTTERGQVLAAQARTSVGLDTLSCCTRPWHLSNDRDPKLVVHLNMEVSNVYDQFPLSF